MPRSILLALTLGLALPVALSGCGKKSVAGRLTSATVGTAGNVASAAARTTGSAASGAVSTTASATSSAASAATNAVAGTSSATAASSGTATSSGVITAPIAVATANTAFAAAYDYQAKEQDGAAMTEGVGNCLRAGPNAASASRLLSAAGWAPAPDILPPEQGGQVFQKAYARGYVLPDGVCVFRSDAVIPEALDTQVRALVGQLYPDAKIKKAANGGKDLCDGFTLKISRRSKVWIHYSDTTGKTCTKIGAGVTVQFL